MEHKHKKRNYLGHSIQLSLLLLWVVFCIAAFGSRLPFLANNNLRFFEVMSGSMSPVIPAGSLIKNGQYRLDELERGDIISFQPRSGAVVTHRIESVEKKELVRADGGKSVEYRYATKGDANGQPDEEMVSSSQILGRYQWHIPWLGYLTHAVKTTHGFVALVIVPGVFLVILEMWLLVMGMKKDMEAKMRESSHAHTTE